MAFLKSRKGYLLLVSKSFIFDKLGYASLIEIEKINLQLIIELKRKSSSLEKFNWFSWPVNPLYTNAREDLLGPQRTLI